MQMSQSVRLNTKLRCAFGVMIAISMILGYTGWSSLDKVEHKVVIGDEANRFVEIINTARLAEKNFMMRGDEEYAKAMLDQKKQFDTLVAEITAKMQVAADKQLVVGMHTDAGTYIDNAQKYVELDKQIVELTAESGPIVQSARHIQKLADEMSQDQGKKLAVVMGVQANIAEKSRDHLNWAGAVKDFLADKDATLNVETDGHKCAFGQWLESSEFNEQVILCGEEFCQLINGMKQKHLELHSSVINVADARKGTTDNSIAVYQQKTAPLLDAILFGFAEGEEILKVQVADRLANLDDAKRINELILETRREEKNYFLRETDAYIGETNSQADSIIALANDLEARFNQQVNKDQIQQVVDAVVVYKKAFDDIVKNKSEQKRCESDMVAAARKLTAEANNLREAKKEEMESVAASANFIMVTLAIAGVVGGVLLAFVITRTTSRKLATETGQLQSSSAQLRSASEQQLNGTAEQTAATGQVFATMKELAATAGQIAERCQQVAQLADSAATRCQEGDDAVREGQSVTNEIKEQIERIVQHMVDLGNKSQQINIAVDVISELSEQTTILSYNAAIEAAAAGEAGQTFSVVADQVGKLADRAKQAAKEVRGMVDEIQKSTSTTIMATEDGLKAADRGMDSQSKASEKMVRVAEEIRSTLDAAREIEMSSKQQTTAAEQVREGLEQITSAAKETEASAKQTLGTAELLVTTATNLDNI